MMNRRHFMSHVAGASALAVPGLSFLHNLRAQADKLKKENKSLIILWMGGGPTHMDLWDVKDPGLPNTGEFKRIKTSAPGVEVSEIMPETAKQMKHLAIVRSLVTNEGSHERGTEKMLIGRNLNPVVPFPHVGSVMANQAASKDLKLPPFITIGGAAANRVNNGQPSGFLGMSYAPFAVQSAGQPPANIGLPSTLAGDPKTGAERMRRRQRLFYNVEDTFAAGSMPHLKSAADREAAGSPAQAHATTYGKAFDLTVSSLRTVFEVRSEPASVLASYGGTANQFGMGCLLARKLVQQGVSCVEVNLGGWDNHANIFATLRNGNGPRLDQGMGALVKDLVEKDLLKNTVVVWMGEFGRTPRINQNGGRDHWGTCWSVVVGGGAIKGGQTYGSTTKDGMAVDTGAASVGDLFATIYKGLGIDPHAKVRDNLGRPLEIADGKPIKALV